MYTVELFHHLSVDIYLYKFTNMSVVWCRLLPAEMAGSENQIWHPSFVEKIRMDYFYWLQYQYGISQ